MFRDLEHDHERARKLQLVSVQDFLAGELVSPIKHEYLGGFVYAMAGTRNAHSIIEVNIRGELHQHLRGKPCQPYSSDTKIRIHLPIPSPLSPAAGERGRGEGATHVRFYYPDASVVCRPNPQTDSFQDEPAVLFEVLSRGTRRIDEGEKRDAYLTIPSLRVYVLVEQEMPAVLVYRRTEQGFVREVYEGLDAVLPLQDIGTSLPLAEMYERVDFVPEGDEEA